MRAQALWELARYQESIAEWTLALRHDPEDADAFIARARCFVRLGRWAPALADLESAVDCSYDRPSVVARAAAGLCLLPDRTSQPPQPCPRAGVPCPSRSESRR